MQVRSGCEVVLLTDRLDEMDPTQPPIPSLLAVGAVHHHLIRSVRHLWVLNALELPLHNRGSGSWSVKIPHTLPNLEGSALTLGLKLPCAAQVCILAVGTCIWTHNASSFCTSTAAAALICLICSIELSAVHSPPVHGGLRTDSSIRWPRLRAA